MFWSLQVLTCHSFPCLNVKIASQCSEKKTQAPWHGLPDPAWSSQAHISRLTSPLPPFHPIFWSSGFHPWLHIKVTWEAFKTYPRLGSIQDQLNQNPWQWSPTRLLLSSHRAPSPLSSFIFLHMSLALPEILSFNIASPPATWLTHSSFKPQLGHHVVFQEDLPQPGASGLG